MKLEQQVTSLELSKRLKELGVKQESLCYWLKMNKAFDTKEWEWFLVEAAKVDGYYKSQDRACSAYTVAELGELLPNYVWYCKKLAEWVAVDTHTNGVYEEVAEKEADARAKMLIYLIDNKLLDPQTL